ncbi:cysteine synthase A [Vaginisenegalia massiliensis]|uniref:cysteine synthase A n=1 Tax=Vaginisenegalia massiliensis TaxID=2058294 RepID=UPI000F533674|nr:cysteine synthase A [Vaginisenegalia massiliensis]
MLYENILETIGRTPLIHLGALDEQAADIYVKLESKNPSGSIKDRAVLYIVNDLFAKGILKEGDTIIEPTSGNTGVGLAMVGAAKQLKVILVMPDSMSVERRNLMTAYGAKLVLTPAAKGMQGAVDQAQELAEELNAPIFGQFTNPANVSAHVETTGPEIIEDLPDLDGFVAGVGTGGTVSGVGKSLKTHRPEITVWAVEPSASPLLSQGQAGPHKIQGIGANFVPANYHADVIDHVFTVENDQAIQTTLELAKTKGILSGISAGANLFAARELAKKLGSGKKVVTVLPDTGERYLSSGIFND